MLWLTKYREVVGGPTAETDLPVNCGDRVVAGVRPEEQVVEAEVSVAERQWGVRQGVEEPRDEICEALPDSKYTGRKVAFEDLQCSRPGLLVHPGDHLGVRRVRVRRQPLREVDCQVATTAVQVSIQAVKPVAAFRPR